LPVFTETAVPTIQEPIVREIPDTARTRWQLITSGLISPVGLANAGDGSGWLYIVEQAGEIRVLRDRELVSEPFLDISERVSCCGERGLLGLAIHPQFAVNGYFFVNYTDINGDTVIARFEVSDDEFHAEPDSEVKLLVIEQPYVNHNGGGIAFGPDGYLYIALGDGGSGGDPLGNAQNTSSLLGKLLRIDVGESAGYGIPPDNPYASGGGAAEVWIYGLRNPWRFSFDRQTGDLFIGDVGQGAWEEIDFLPAGSPGGVNYGWNLREGSYPYTAGSADEDLELIDPVAEYGRDQGYSVIGGVVYWGEQLLELQGIYLYGDYGSGNIWGLYPDDDGSWQNWLLFQTGSRITSFGVDESGEVYYVTQDGGLYQLIGG
jgi:glucose/arabinose dehydrogenase